MLNASMSGLTWPAAVAAATTDFVSEAKLLPFHKKELPYIKAANHETNSHTA